MARSSVEQRRTTPSHEHAIVALLLILGRRASLGCAPAPRISRVWRSFRIAKTQSQNHHTLIEDPADGRLEQRADRFACAHGLAESLYSYYMHCNRPSRAFTRSPLASPDHFSELETRGLVMRGLPWLQDFLVLAIVFGQEDYVSHSTTTVADWSQCGGAGYVGSTTCTHEDLGSVCTKQSDAFSICVPPEGRSHFGDYDLQLYGWLIESKTFSNYFFNNTHYLNDWLNFYYSCYELGHFSGGIGFCGSWGSTLERMIECGADPALNQSVRDTFCTTITCNFLPAAEDLSDPYVYRNANCSLATPTFEFTITQLANHVCATAVRPKACPEVLLDARAPRELPSPSLPPPASPSPSSLPHPASPLPPAPAPTLSPLLPTPPPPPPPTTTTTTTSSHEHDDLRTKVGEKLKLTADKKGSGAFVRAVNEFTASATQPVNNAQLAEGGRDGDDVEAHHGGGHGGG